MEPLCYLEEHLSCSRYKEDIDLGFKFVDLEKGSVFDGRKKEFHYMIFLLDGELTVSCNSDLEQVLCAKSFFLIPKSAEFFCQAQTSSSLLIFSFDSLISVCEKMQLESYSEICAKTDDSFKSLDINYPLNLYIELLKTYLDCSMNCAHIHEIKHQELFLILRGYYTKEELAALFRPIVGSHYDFRDLILKNYLKVNNLEDLIQLSGMGKTRFNTKFKEAFSTSAYQWILKQKSKHIKYRLSESGVTLNDIMMEFNFSSATHLTRFCKQQFGCTPTELKKQVGKNS